MIETTKCIIPNQIQAILSIHSEFYTNTVHTTPPLVYTVVSICNISLLILITITLLSFALEGRVTAIKQKILLLNIMMMSAAI